MGGAAVGGRETSEHLLENQRHWSGRWNGMGMMGKVEWEEGERKGKKERKKEKKGGREEKPYSLMIAATWAGNVATTWCPAGTCRHDYDHRTSL